MSEIIEIRIARFLANLPREELKYQVKEDLCNFWKALRQHNQLVTVCFESRVFKANNPIAHLREDKLGKMYHDFVWRNVDVYEALWGLVQISFDYIKEDHLEHLTLKFLPDDAFDLFMQIVGTERDNEFKIALHYYRVSVSETLTLWELIRKAAWSGLSQKEQKKLKHLTSQDPRNCWLEHTYAICQRKAKTDSLIADKLQDFRKQVGRLADAHFTLISNARKGRVPLKLQSFEFRDQQQFFANRYGGSYGA